jgi:uncharacterized protein YdhG (YjbR/CyaY superfamily)
MAGRKAATTAATKAADRTSGAAAKPFSDAERAAMRERAREVRAAKGDGETEVLAKIAEMPAPDRVMAERIHALIKASVPALAPTTWYGMPAYAKDGKTVVFFQPAAKFKTRYATLGFSDKAHLDDGGMWPSSYAIHELTPDVEKRLSALVKQAAS